MFFNIQQQSHINISTSNIMHNYYYTILQPLDFVWDYPGEPAPEM